MEGRRSNWLGPSKPHSGERRVSGPADGCPQGRAVTSILHWASCQTPPNGATASDMDSVLAATFMSI